MPLIISEQVTVQLRQEMMGYNLFHRCITDCSPYHMMIEDQHAQIPEPFRIANTKRVSFAERLLFHFTDPVLDFNTPDDHGLSVLHRSIVVYDVEYTKFVIKAISSMSTLPINERRFSLNLNTRCQKRGWAPIHYAVDRANIPSMRLLAHAGANLQASSATDKRMIPLELAKARLKAAQQANAAMKALAERVLSVLNELIQWQKTAAKDSHKSSNSKRSESKGGERTNGEQQAKKKSSSTTTPEKEKEKTTESVVGSSSKTSEKKKKSTAADGKKKGDFVELSSQSAASTAVSGTGTKQQQNGSSGNGNGKPPSISNTTSNNQQPQRQHSSSATTPIAAAAMSVASRDEMVDGLLAMGFKEADCLAAVTRYGTDLDQAISWLCERPNSSANGSSNGSSNGINGKATAADQRALLSERQEVSKKATTALAVAVDQANAMKQHQPQQVPIEPPKPPTASIKDDQVQQQESAVKEDLRSINRAWNAKTLEERKVCHRFSCFYFSVVLFFSL